MKKAIWVVAVDNYRPDICAKTFPTILQYSKDVGATFNIISKRKWRSQPTYEKLQVHSLGINNDMNVILDADIEIPNGMFNVFERVADDRVSSWMAYDASQHYQLDEYFYRDGRRLGVCFSFVSIPRTCMDALTPFKDNELPMMESRLKRPFMIDEYCLSRNMAQYGIKHSGILNGEEFASPPMKHFNNSSGNDSHTVIR